MLIRMNAIAPWVSRRSRPVRWVLSKLLSPFVPAPTFQVLGVKVYNDHVLPVMRVYEAAVYWEPSPLAKALGEKPYTETYRDYGLTLWESVPPKGGESRLATQDLVDVLVPRVLTLEVARAADLSAGGGPRE